MSCRWTATILATQRKTCMVSNVPVNMSDTVHVLCVAKMVTGGNKRYMGQLYPSGFL